MLSNYTKPRTIKGIYFHMGGGGGGGVDSVKSTCIVTILEEGDFIEEEDGFDCRCFSVGGYVFVEEGV